MNDNEKKSTQAQIDASVRYNRKQDNIMIRPSKEEGKKIREAASGAGQSVQAYILQAIRDRIERDNAAARGFGNSDTVPAEE